MDKPVSTKPRDSTSSNSTSTSHSSSKRKHSSSISSDPDTSHSSLSTTSKKPKSNMDKKKKHEKKPSSSTEIILLSSDSEEGDNIRRPTPPPPPPAVDPDKIEKAMDEIKRRIPGCDLKRAFLLYKKTRQSIERTVEMLKGEMKDRKGGKGKGKGQEKEKEKEKRKPKVSLEKKSKSKEVEMEIDELDDEGVDDDGGKPEEEVDELESDPEDDGMDEESYWLDVEARSEALDEDAELAKTYRKTAWYQLCTDYSTTHESQIRHTFKLESCGELYAPTWLALRKIKKSVDHIKLTRGERNMDKRKTKDGKWVDRVTPEIPRKLELEMNWLEKYVMTDTVSDLLVTEGGYGKGKGKAKDKGKGKATVKVSPRKPVQPKKAAAPQPKKKSISKPSPKKKKSIHRDFSDDFDCEDGRQGGGGGGWGGHGWGEEALDRAYKSPKKHRSPGNGKPRFSAWRGGEQMIGGSGSQRRDSREPTVAFSGKGRSLA
ncbi:hypothetical protein JCM5353_007773 [Sporobolomyces roseus]